MKKPILFLLILFSSLSFCAAGEVTLTLDEAVALALRDNRDILLSASEVNKAKAKLEEAKAGALPSLNLTAGWSDTRGYYSKDLGQTTAQGTLKQTLYAGGKVVNTIKYNEYGLVVAEALLDKTKLEIALNVKKSFYALLLTEEFAALNKNILQNTEEHLDSLRKRYAGGEAGESEVLKVEASLESVRQAYEASLNQAEEAAALLNNTLSLDKDIRIRLQSETRLEQKEAAYDEAFLQAIKNRPEIRRYEAGVGLAEKAVEIAKAGNRPSVSASWDYYSRSHLTGTTTRNWNDYNAVGLTVTWPIFDGWATKAKVEQALVDLKSARLLKEKSSGDIALEFKSAYLTLKTSLAGIKSTQTDAQFYKNKLSEIEDKYKAGMMSLLDLHDASLGYAVALFKQKEALYDYLSAKAGFDKAMGGL
jgi:outer membrane protein